VSTQAVTAGKVAVVSFIYTACSDRLGCPLASLALQSLQARVKDEGLSGSVALLSISFDPGRDTRAVLGEVRAGLRGRSPALALHDRAVRAGPRGCAGGLWPGSRARLRRARTLHRRYRHVLKVFLLDQDGYIRNVYSAGFLVADLVVNDIKTVLTER
jgi:cytochrome oxidase Cu insertion factor (SCO1/SenC/PrrC family)